VKEMSHETRQYKTNNKPEVLSHQQIVFETAQSWNKGKGNLNHPGTGNGGVNYPNDPYTGPHHGNGGGNGKGKGKK
jgi:hypothetical protein